MRVTNLAHLILQSRIQPGTIAIDATVGNGHDTRFLAGCVGASGHVYGFDIQAAALARTRAALGDISTVTLFHAGHERLAERLPPRNHGSVTAITFNLGYLPGGDKTVVTQADTSIQAIRAGLSVLAVRGLISVIAYTGHPGGSHEAAAIASLGATLPENFTMTHTRTISVTQGPVPELLLIERLR